MKKLALTLVAALPLLWAAAPAAAQQDGPPRMYHIYQDFVTAAMIPEYEAAAREFVQTLAATPDVNVSFMALSGPEVGYIYASPLESFADLDQMNRNWEAALSATGEKGAKAMAQASKAVNHSASFVMVLREDLSYRLETTEISADMPYRHYSWWYTIPGKEMELEAVAKEFAQLYESNGIERGWRILQAANGPDLPLYLVIFNATDMASYHATSAEIDERLGDADDELLQRAMRTARRVESSYSFVRPDLSFPARGCG